ncbi:MAG: patatin-like phospholipase family protein [Crocinitomicaceae bacterium]|nr:patatin-like phospholipase family protein [Crocinitomicaceae bacterium]
MTKRKLIITIDGGGIRGIIPLVVLRQIQNQLDKSLFDISDKWYGTSTGALISAGILIQDQDTFSNAVQNVLDIYEFRSGSSVNPLGSSKPERALHKILDENFEENTFERLPKLHVVSCKKSDFSVEVFSLKNNVSVAESLKASCAVPGIFDPVKIKGDYYIDGFIKAKNPALIALENEIQNENLILLSLGTGILREIDETEIQVRATHKQCEELAAKNGFHYFRFNPTLEEAADNMQDARLKNIFALKKDTENYLERKKSKLDDLIRLLN